ncbi:hypothetical protein B0T10DRAFT_609262 [Thelonectria olida]|uniref:ORC1/DEAH AAA+ ATPase domain-containing protein n=1 Tax=Thelonectria olida TaxID=1576542 RepID=A0A9P8VWJ8_9HYPO|nr:hypothetical protein B0T10DRAFT_609262 [Thelonectria olida]
MSGVSFHGPIDGRNVLAGTTVSAGGILNAHFNSTSTNSHPSAAQPCRVIPYPRNEDIIHRPDLFTKLETLLPSAAEYHSAALWGLGGSGKTQIALEYAYRRCRDPACSIFWVHADNETTFAQDFKIIAKKLGLDNRLDGEKLLVAVRERIESQPQWLLVLDNADNLDLFGVAKTSKKLTSLLDYVPRGPTGTVLWTSRDEQIAGTLVGSRRGIRAAQMQEEEAKALLETARNEALSSEELEDVTVLLGELQWLPLAISQAGAYMRGTSTPIKEYLSGLLGKKRWLLLLEETKLDRHRRDGVPNSILETWSISIDRIRQESTMAYNILHTIAYLENQNIPLELITAIATFYSKAREQESSKNEELVKKAITRLREFSFLTAYRLNDGEQSFEMHRLVQGAIRYGLNMRRFHEVDSIKAKPTSRNRIRTFIRRQSQLLKNRWEDKDERYFSSAALQIISDLFPSSKREMWTQCEKYLAQAVRVGDWAEICGKEVEVSTLLSQVSNYLYDRGRWREKERVDARALKLRQEVLGEKHPQTIQSMGELAATYHAQGRYDEDEDISVKVLKLRREVLGEKHPDTIRSMGELAATYHAQGRYDEAEEINVKVLELRREVLGEKHPDTIRSMGELAATYHAQGRYDEAEEIKVKVLELRREALGEKHPDTIQSMGSLAATYHAQGRYDEDEKISVKVLELRREVLGEKHPDTIWSMGELAATYHAQGRYDEDEDISVKVLKLRREVLGEKHPDTIRSMGDLAATCRAQGRYDEAEEIKVKVLELRREVLGEKHPDTIRSMGELAATYHAQGRYDKAEEIKVKVLELRREVLGEKHLDTIQSMGELATTYHAQGRYDKAEEIKVKVLELRREVLGDKHPHTLQAMHDLAVTWNSHDRSDDAVGLMEKCWKLRCTALGPEHPFTQDSKSKLKRWGPDREDEYSVLG